MIFRRYLPAVGLALVALASYVGWLWQPERQVRLHTSHFLQKVERRNWADVEKFLAADYADRWEHTRESAIADAREAFRQFIFVTIENRTTFCEVAGENATARTIIRISGQGGPVAQAVMERVNNLRAPFVFAWRKGSWKPWDWKLVGVDQPELSTERFGGF